MTLQIEPVCPEQPLPSAAEAPPAVADSQLEFVLAAEDAASLARLPGFSRAGPSRPAALVWHDDGEGSLAAQGIALLRDGRTWRLHALEPGHGRDWPPCSPAPLLGEGAGADLSPTPPFDAAPIAGFQGKRHVFVAETVRLTVLQGSLRGLFDDRPSCRLCLSGPASDLAALLDRLAAYRTDVPRASLATEAMAAAKGGKLPARHLGAPAIAADTALSDGLALIVAHLLDALLHWVDEFRRDPRPQPVHQGRVAIRRLRSALSLYRRAFPAQELADLAAALRACATRLGAARDWDVFMGETAAPLAEAAQHDARFATLLRGADRQRRLAYANVGAYLASPAFRRIELAVGAAATLRPWERSAGSEALRAPTAEFAARALTIRLKHVRRRGRGMADLPLTELHELRKDCKRLRYASEFFAPAFAASKDVKPFVQQLSLLQEELGHLNDGAVACHLMAQLGRAGRGYAGGMVEGWAAAAARPARRRIEKSWKRFKNVPPFWTG